MWGRVRTQFTQPKVQNSRRTTLPLRLLIVRGELLSHPCRPLNSGACFPVSDLDDKSCLKGSLLGYNPAIVDPLMTPSRRQFSKSRDNLTPQNVKDYFSEIDCKSHSSLAISLN